MEAILLRLVQANLPEDLNHFQFTEEELRATKAGRIVLQSWNGKVSHELTKNTAFFITALYAYLLRTRPELRLFKPSQKWEQAENERNPLVREELEAQAEAEDEAKLEKVRKRLDPDLLGSVQTFSKLQAEQAHNRVGRKRRVLTAENEPTTRYRPERPTPIHPRLRLWCQTEMSLIDLVKATGINRKKMGRILKTIGGKPKKIPGKRPQVYESKATADVLGVWLSNDHEDLDRRIFYAADTLAYSEIHAPDRSAGFRKALNKKGVGLFWKLKQLPPQKRVFERLLEARRAKHRPKPQATPALFDFPIDKDPKSEVGFLK